MYSVDEICQGCCLLLRILQSLWALIIDVDVTHSVIDALADDRIILRFMIKQIKEAVPRMRLSTLPN